MSRRCSYKDEVLDKSHEAGGQGQNQGQSPDNCQDDTRWAEGLLQPGATRQGRGQVRWVQETGGGGKGWIA